MALALCRARSVHRAARGPRKLDAPAGPMGARGGTGLPTSPHAEPPRGAEGTAAPAEGKGDVRLGGWILVLVGVVLVLTALVLAILFV